MPYNYLLDAKVKPRPLGGFWPRVSLGSGGGPGITGSLPARMCGRASVPHCSGLPVARVGGQLGAAEMLRGRIWAVPAPVRSSVLALERHHTWPWGRCAPASELGKLRRLKGKSQAGSKYPGVSVSRRAVPKICVALVTQQIAQPAAGKVPLDTARRTGWTGKVREMQTKTSGSWPCLPTKMAEIQNTSSKESARTWLAGRLGAAVVGSIVLPWRRLRGPPCPGPTAVPRT